MPGPLSRHAIRSPHPLRATAMALGLAVALAACGGTSGSGPDPGAPGYTGTVGVDWVEAEVTGLPDGEVVGDLAYGAGRWWVLTGVWRQGGAHRESGRAELWVSDDAVVWEAVDLGAVGIPDFLTGDARLLGTETEIIVVFSNALEALETVTQPAPWILRGDGEAWRVAAPAAFGSWQLTGSGREFSYEGAGPIAVHGETVVMAADAMWWVPNATSGSDVGIITLDASGSGRMSSADAPPFGGRGTRRVGALVSVGGELLGIGFQSVPRDAGVGRRFTIWRSADAVSWTSEQPELTGALPFTSAYSAVVGPGGIVAVGEENPADGDFAGRGNAVVLYSADGRDWARIPLDTPHRLETVVATADGFYAFHAPSNDTVTWFSADGRDWSQAGPWTTGRFGSVTIASSGDSIVGILGTTVSRSGPVTLR